MIVLTKSGSYPTDGSLTKLLEGMKSKLKMYAEMDFYKLLRDYWRRHIVRVIVSTLAFAIIISSALYNGTFPEICQHVFTGTITVMGVIAGLVPLISFFYVERVREQELKIAQDWRNIRDKLRIEFKKEDVELFSQTTNLLLKSYQNWEMSVLKYTKEFTSTSLSAFLLMIFLYTAFMASPTLVLEIAAFSTIVINIMTLGIIISGVLPLLNVAVPHSPTGELLPPFPLRELHDILEYVQKPSYP